LLVGGASARFGAPKALARVEGQTLAERAWETLGEICAHRLAVGKSADRLDLPFPIIDDAEEERAAIIGLVAGLKAAPTDLCIVLPTDCPSITPEALFELAEACADRDAAVPQTGPLPGAYRKSTLMALEGGERSIRRVLDHLDVATVNLDEALLLNVNSPQDLERLHAR
jgi:molybdenum cofactor guanylyltransferase